MVKTVKVRAGLVIFPLMLIYAVIRCSVFRGDIGTINEHY
jgi:hypothetical protein